MSGSRGPRPHAAAPESAGFAENSRLPFPRGLQSNKKTNVSVASSCELWSSEKDRNLLEWFLASTFTIFFATHECILYPFDPDLNTVMICHSIRIHTTQHGTHGWSCMIPFGVWHTPVDLPGSQRTKQGSMTREDVQWNQATAGMPYILYSNKHINILYIDSRYTSGNESLMRT